MDTTKIPDLIPLEHREWFCLFAIAVAGKQAKATEKKLDKFLQDVFEQSENWSGTWLDEVTPFRLIKAAKFNHKLEELIYKHKFGQYKRIISAFSEIINLDITKDLNVIRLEQVPGIGPKTSRFIVLYTQEDARVAALDTHILKYLAKEYPYHKIPKSTPTTRWKYRELENLFLYRCDKLGKTPRELDNEIWRSYAKYE